MINMRSKKAFVDKKIEIFGEMMKMKNFRKQDCKAGFMTV